MKKPKEVLVDSSGLIVFMAPAILFGAVAMTVKFGVGWGVAVFFSAPVCLLLLNAGLELWGDLALSVQKRVKRWLDER